MATYNSGHFLLPAIESVLRQSLSTFEFLIVDDSSSDETYALLQKYADSDARIKLVRNAVNRGMGHNFRQMVDKAQTNYIACIGHDDLWAETYLERLIAELDTFPEAAFAFSPADIIDESDSPRFDYGPYDYRPLIGLPRHTFFRKLFARNFICAPSAIFRKSALRLPWQLGDLDDTQDWLVWLELAANFEYRIVLDRLVKYRIHGANMSLFNYRERQYKREILLCYYHAIRQPGFADLVLADEDPNGYLASIVDQFHHVQPTHEYDVLLETALRHHAHRLDHLDSYHEALGRILWHAGALSHARRELRMASNRSAFLARDANSIKTVFCVQRIKKEPRISAQNTPEFRVWDIGGFRVIRVYLAHPILSRWTLRWMKGGHKNPMIQAEQTIFETLYRPIGLVVRIARILLRPWLGLSLRLRKLSRAPQIRP